MKAVFLVIAVVFGGCQSVTLTSSEAPQEFFSCICCCGQTGNEPEVCVDEKEMLKIINASERNTSSCPNNVGCTQGTLYKQC